MLINSILIAPHSSDSASPGLLSTTARLIARHGRRHLTSHHACLFPPVWGKFSVICGGMGGAAHSYAEKIQETKRSSLFFELEHHPPHCPGRK